ncbi:MAG TPA: LysR substrate-binding domain-containing protein [Burkholderiaceae bacterium]|nr:LysR substrate-binding domain-containing protein [Burkholderiaceae bacterium]
MTLTELKYIVAVARERHFGRAAEACFVSQPTLSVAIKKLEEELGVQLFERRSQEVVVTSVGERVIEQARRVLEDAGRIKEIARLGKDPLAGPLQLGVIYTIGPYLLPALVRQLMQVAPQMPLMIQESYTVRLIDMLKSGDIDVAIMAEPVPESGLMAQAVYEESFVVAVPRAHPWAGRTSIEADELKKATLLLLGAGHCFRDQVLEVCPEFAQPLPTAEGIQKTFEGSSLETIRQMVASGLGLTVLPASSVPAVVDANALIRYIPFAAPVPQRRVVLVWRKSYLREAAIATLAQAIRDCHIEGIRVLDTHAQPV